MDDALLNTIKSLTTQLEKFLKSCKQEGDKTIDDVLKRLDELKKE
jgi:hypothetical protein